MRPKVCKTLSAVAFALSLAFFASVLVLTFFPGISIGLFDIDVRTEDVKLTASEKVFFLSIFAGWLPLSVLALVNVLIKNTGKSSAVERTVICAFIIVVSSFGERWQYGRFMIFVSHLYGAQTNMVYQTVKALIDNVAGLLVVGAYVLLFCSFAIEIYHNAHVKGDINAAGDAK